MHFLKHLALGLLLIATPCSSLVATTTGNYAEMTLTLIATVVDIAANYCALSKNKNTATKLKCATDGLNLLTRGLFFYNNVAAKEGLGGWNFDIHFNDRDCQALTAITIRDTTKLAQHLYELYQSLPEEMSAELSDLNITPESLEADLNAQITTTENVQQEPSASAIEYARKVIILPALKGLTAFAVACTQNYATSYSGDQARYTATAAHCFANLLEEYSNLGPNSKLNTPLIIALLVNAVWLAGETNLYIDEQRDVRGIVRQNVEHCAHCNQDSNYKRLDCGHFRCTHCLRDGIIEQNGNNVADVDHVVCGNPGCNHHLNRQEVELVCGNDPEIMHAFDHAQFNRPPAAPPGGPIRIAAPPAAGPIVPLLTRAGECIVCHDADIRVVDQVVILGCGHATQCTGCRRAELQGFFNGDRANLDHVPCHHAGCNHHLTRNEVRALLGRENLPAADGQAARTPAEILQGFDLAAFDRANPQAAELDEEMRALIARGEARICPGCRNGVQRNEGCNHMTCRCGVQFCYVCNARWGNGCMAFQCANPGLAPAPADADDESDDDDFGPRPARPALGRLARPVVRPIVPALDRRAFEEEFRRALGPRPLGGRDPFAAMFEDMLRGF